MNPLVSESVRDSEICSQIFSFRIDFYSCCFRPHIFLKSPVELTHSSRGRFDTPHQPPKREKWDFPNIRFFKTYVFTTKSHKAASSQRHCANTSQTHNRWLAGRLSQSSGPRSVWKTNQCLCGLDVDIVTLNAQPCVVTRGQKIGYFPLQVTGARSGFSWSFLGNMPHWLFYMVPLVWALAHCPETGFHGQ